MDTFHHERKLYLSQAANNYNQISVELHTLGRFALSLYQFNILSILYCHVCQSCARVTFTRTKEIFGLQLFCWTPLMKPLIHLTTSENDNRESITQTMQIGQACVAQLKSVYNCVLIEEIAWFNCTRALMNGPE